MSPISACPHSAIRRAFAVKVSIIIIPAFNEEAYLPATLATVRAGVDHLRARCATDAAVSVNVIVVDNNSTDETAAVARNEGSRVVYEPVQGIARARNTGAPPCRRRCARVV